MRSLTSKTAQQDWPRDTISLEPPVIVIYMRETDFYGNYVLSSTMNNKLPKILGYTTGSQLLHGREFGTDGYEIKAGQNGPENTTTFSIMSMPWPGTLLRPENCRSYQ